MTGTAVVPIVKHLSGSAPYSVDTRISFADGAVRITGETPAVDILSPSLPPLEKTCRTNRKHSIHIFLPRAEQPI